MAKFFKLVAFLFIEILGIYCIAQAASINDLEYQKFTTDSDGNPAIRIVLPDGGGGSSQWLSGSGCVYYNAGNVGIGTTTPTAKLDITGNANVSGTLTAGALVSTGTGNSTLNVSSGNVGIGTASPLLKFHVNGDWRLGDTLSESGTTAYYKGVEIGTGSSNTISQLNSNVTVTDAGDGYISMTEDGTEYWRLTGGNVGIGITVPTSKLHVSGGIKADSANPTVAFTGASGVAVPTVAQLIVYDGSNTGIIDLTTRGANVRITDDMSVGTDLTISNNLSVNNTVRAKNVDLDKLASGTGVCYAVVVQSDGTLAKSGTVWNK